MSERIGIAQPEDEHPHNCWALIFGLGGGQCVHKARPGHLTCHEHAGLERAALALCAATDGLVYGPEGHGTTTGYAFFADERPEGVPASLRPAFIDTLSGATFAEIERLKLAGKDQSSPKKEG